MKIHLGIDVGSTSVNTIVMDDGCRILEDHYTFCHGRPFHVLRDVVSEITRRRAGDTVGIVAFTGTGGRTGANLVGGTFVNEIVAQSSSVTRLYSRAKSVIEMGGEDSKLILLTGIEDASQLEDFAMNSMCAAGTGSFLDQQAKRIGVSIEKEFGELALQSENPPRIAGRCSVFAKTDMIHLQQIATPVHDIVAGLCFAVARNFKSNLARGKRIDAPVVFQGGVAANAGMIRAFRETLGLAEDELIIPEHHASMGAIGALYHVMDTPAAGDHSFKGTRDLDEHLLTGGNDTEALEPLHDPDAVWHKESTFVPPETGRLGVYLGLDVGSLSTNVVLIDEENTVIARRYLPTASRPLEAIRRGLAEIREEVGDHVEVLAAGTTGSGRYLTGDFIGADTIQNEITAQATAAIAIDPEVDTIFEIGGQDSKFISIDNGVVVDFEMNKVCAAGTGSFLEEQAEKLDINIVEEFGDLALRAPAPAPLGDRCTVFMESDLNSFQQKGTSKEDLVGGLAYSIVYNYIQKVVGTKRIGERIFFQGGVTNNKAVVAAFEKVTGKKIIVPPHFDVTGAIGAAMLARTQVRESGRQASRFKGFDVSTIPYTVDKFTCKSCSNQCEIRRVRIEGETRPLYYGGRCEKYELEERKGRGGNIPNLFDERFALLMGDFSEEEAQEEAQEEADDGRITIGIPRGLMVFFQQFPFWRSFFEHLGFRVVLSRPSDRQLVTTSLEMLTAETCFPVELMYGHVQDLLDRGVDYVFAPFIVNARAEEGNPTINYNCPWIQSYPFMIRASLRGSEHEGRLLTPTLHFRYYERVLPGDLSEFMGETFATPRRRVIEALACAGDAQESFEAAVRERGRAVLDGLGDDGTAVVVIGRPYNSGDPALNLGLVEKLINQDILPIPLDYLPLGGEDIFDDYPRMYWPNGQKILSACRIIARDERLNAVYLGNFRCGPDSFVQHYVREEMGGKPYLQLEVDEHSADAGMITRLEAFLDSLRGQGVSGRSRAPGAPVHHALPLSHLAPDRTVYIPYMNDTAHAVAAASRHCGVDTEVLPEQDAEDLKLARKHLSSKECFPMICTTGSFLRKLMEPGVDPRKAAFFMPDHGGPCRFGQYNKMQRIIFDRLGYKDAEIVAPINEDAYAGLSAGHGNRFRLTALRSILAVDLLRKLLQERRPYETEMGATDGVYQECLQRIIRSTESGAADIAAVLAGCVEEFDRLGMVDGPRKPVIAVVGEIFMRDNPFCSGNLIGRLEKLGGETVIAPFKEWMTYSTLRYGRDSKWKGDFRGLIKSRIQQLFTSLLARPLDRAVRDSVEMERDIPIEEMLDQCAPYVHRDYDGDPPIALGGAAALVKTGISGVANILPFMCAPGTLISAVSGSFRKDHGNIPWINIDYDGQSDTGLDTRLQAFMYQAGQYVKANGLDAPRSWR